MPAELDLEAAVGRIRTRVRPSPVPGHEHQGGWGILAHSFDSVHVLALRVALHNDFAPYTSVWHRTPDGDWSIYVDGPRLDIACPRYWGAATEHVATADISVEWTGPRNLLVEMADPSLRWTATMAAGPVVRAANAVARRVPDRVLRSRPVVRLAEWASDRLFDLGDVTLAMTVPNGQDAVVLTRRLFPIVDGSASLDGVDLGESAALADTPTFGEARLPARPVFTIARAYLSVLDEAEYERTIAELRGGHEPDDGGGSGPRTAAEGAGGR